MWQTVMRLTHEAQKMREEPHINVWAFGLILTTLGFFALAGHAWAEAKVALYWRPGVAVVTGFRQEGHPRVPQESFSTIIVRMSLPSGRQIQGFTINRTWNLRSWPREDIPQRIGDELVVYIDPTDASRVVPKHEIDVLSPCLMALFCSAGAFRFAAALIESQRRSAESHPIGNSLSSRQQSISGTDY